MPETLKLDENAEIIENTLINSRGKIYRLVLRAPKIAGNARPGQMIHIKTGGEDSAMTLRRPFSLAGMEEGLLTVCYAVVGSGTEWLAAQTAGKLDILGPVGNGYPIPDSGRVLLVGGGTGIFSVLGAASVLGDRAKALLGFREGALVNSTGDFEAYGTPAAQITDDGSRGRKGFVTELLDEELQKGGYDRIFVCGPHIMMKNASKIAEAHGVDCYVSLEERMGCGIGACMACVCRIVRGDGETYKRVCVDGPVFNSKEVIW